MVNVFSGKITESVNSVDDKNVKTIVAPRRIVERGVNPFTFPLKYLNREEFRDAI